MNNNQYNYGNQGNGYNPNGGYNPPPVDPYGSPFNNRELQAQIARSKANTAQTLGIIALVGLITAGIIALVCGILAITYAGSSRQILGYDLPEAARGRTMGIVALAISAASIVLLIVVVATLI